MKFFFQHLLTVNAIAIDDFLKFIFYVIYELIAPWVGSIRYENMLIKFVDDFKVIETTLKKNAQPMHFYVIYKKHKK